MMASLLVLCMLLLTTPGGLGSCDQEAGSYRHTICVTNSSTSSECCRNEKVCDSFDCIRKSITNSTFVLFESTDNITLNSSIWFTDLYDIAFAGLNSQGTRIVCNTSEVTDEIDSGAGLGFVKVRNLKLVGLIFEQCGALHKSTTPSTTRNAQMQNSTLVFKSSIYILNSSDITIMNVVIEKSSGNALTLFDTIGVVTINSSHFLWNLVPESEKETFPGGGGVYIEFTYCPPGKVGQCDNVGQRNKGSRYHFQDCTFENNIATSLNITSVSHHTPHIAATDFQGLGKGGGMSIVFNGNAEDSKIHVRNCTYLNNTAVWGGGLYIGFQDSVGNNTVFVSDSIFESNVCHINAGGGADVGYLFLNDEQGKNPTNNTIRFTMCEFKENRARYGGGVAVYSNKHHKDLKNTIVFTNCTWKENVASFGSAVDVEPLIMWDSLGTTDGTLPSPVFENSHFISNVILEEISYVPNHPWVQTKDSEGGFTAIGFTIKFKGELYFENHSSSAMYVISCILEFDSETNATFINNSGFAGGAISLIGLSWMYVNENSTFTFINNTATDRGGAISVQSTSKQGLTLSHTCFLMYKGKQVTERNLKFMFYGNRVETLCDRPAGNSIFLTSLQPCQSECHRHAATNNSEIPLDCIGNFIYGNDSNEPYKISTEGGGVKLNSDHSSPLKVIPGKEFNLPFSSEDDLKQTINSHYSVAIKNLNGSEIRIDDTYSHISHDKLKLFGHPEDKGQVVLSQVGARRTVISLNVSMRYCPPGFNFSCDNKCTCTCITKLYRGIIRCNHSNFQAYIDRGYWIGYVNSSTKEELFSGYCPAGFCFNDDDVLREIEHPLDVSSKDELDSLICRSTRTGTLCGDCRENYTAYFHSEDFQCDSSDYCSMGLLFYTISELLPLTVLFLVAIVFNISFTSGAVNAFIFFAQVIDSIDTLANKFIRFQPWVFGLTKIHRFVYRMFNLDFFSVDPLAFCLWKGAKSIDVIAFKYVTVVYALILVISTILLMNICNCYRCCHCVKPRTVKSSVIHGISAFLVMCYAQSTEVSFLLLSPSLLCSIGPTCKDYVVRYHGNTVFLSKAHLPYAVPAVVFLVIITALPTVLLLVYPVHYKILALLKLNENRRVQQVSRYIPIEKLKPFFDSFQSCYKDNFRFFSGLFFVYRLSILLISSISKNLTMFYTFIEAQLIFMLVIHALAQPYEKRWHNAVDILTFADLAIINGITLFNFAYTRETGFQHRVDISSPVQLLLIYLPMIYLVTYIIFYLASKMNAYFKCKQTEETIDDFDVPARLIYSDEDSDAEEAEYRNFEEYELQDLSD